MTPWERVRASKRGEACDRVPCVPFMGELKCALTGASYWDFWHSGEALQAVESAAFQRWAYDRIAIGPNTRGISEALGASTVYPQQGLPYEGEALLQSYEMLDGLQPFDASKNPRLRPFFQAGSALMQSYGDTVPIEASIGGPFTIAANLRGAERLLRDCRRQPQRVLQLLRLVVDCQKSCIDKAASLGMGIAMADPVANPALIGPKLYGNMVFPLTLELCEYALRKCGRAPSLHMCGHTENIWEYFCRYPLNEISLDNVVDLASAAQKLGCAVPIAGNVDPVQAIMQGPAGQLREAVRRCIEAGRGSACGFTLASGCDIPPGTPFEQIDMLMDFCREAGC